MTTKQTGTILRYLRSLVDPESARHLSDTQLLEQFAAEREEAAFAALVQRHGALVWGVCLHLLHHEQDAEDAFQATFLVLARRAGSIRKGEAVGSFLYGVAYRIALRIKQNTKKSQIRERQAASTSAQQPPDDLGWRELQAMLDEEVVRLPEKYRSPFVLCCLAGKSRAEAAQELRCKEGTICSRIARARALLQKRLAQRGVTLSAALCAGVLWKQSAAASMPAVLASRTAQAASASAGGFSTAVTALADGVLHTMGFGRWSIGGALILGVSLLAAAAGVSRNSVIEAPEAAPQEAQPNPVDARKDRHGDPLPPEALARLGTVRQRAPGSHLAVTADGKEIIAVGDDLTVRRFDAKTGELRSLRQLPKASRVMQYHTWLSPRGTYVLTETDSEPRYHLALWDLAAGKPRQKLRLSAENDPGICSAAFSADERRAAVADCSLDRRTLRILLWDLQTSQSKVLWSEKKNDIHSFYFEPVVIFSPDGKRLITCHYDQILRCWDGESGKLLWRSEKKNWSPLIVFSADSRTLIIPSGIGTNGINRWDAATGKLLESNKPPKEALFPIGTSPDGQYLAFQTGKEEVVLWEPGKEKVTFQFPRPPYRRDDPVLFQPNRVPTNFAFTPDSKGFIRRAGALQRWDLTTGKPIFADTENWGHTEEVTRLLYSPDGRMLASSSEDKTVRLWEISTTRTLDTIPKESDHLAFTPDGRFLLTVPYVVLGGKNVLQATDVITRRPGRTFGLANQPDVSTVSIRGNEMRLTADGKKIMMLTWHGNGNSIKIWKVVTGECLVNKDIHLREQPVTQEESRLTPDGESVLAFDHVSQAVRLLSLETVRPRWQLKMEPVNQAWHYYDCNLVLSPNGRMMAARLHNPNFSGVQERHESIILADMATGRQLAKLPADGPAVFDYSADNRMFAVAGPAGIQFWETATVKEVGFIPIPNRDARPQSRACASSLAFSPDGRILATGHADGTILLWDMTLRGGRHGGQLSAVQRETLWNDLAAMDAVKAYAAVWQLADDPSAAIALLKGRLKSVAPVPLQMLRSLLEDLDSDQFAVRESAQQRLRALGERVASSLRAELKAKPSLEKRKRLEEVLAATDESIPASGEPLRGLRAVQVLERIGSVEARQLLEELSRGVESARLTKAAVEALARLKKR